MIGPVEPDEPDETAPILYREVGSSWWPVAWGPIFAAIGAGVEATTGPVHALAWSVVGIGLAAAAAVWVQARRRFCSVLLTRYALHQGREILPVSRIAEITDVGAPLGARVLGGGWAVPKRFVEVPLRLRDEAKDDGSADGTGSAPRRRSTVVIAWAQDPAALRAALRPLVDA